MLVCLSVLALSQQAIALERMVVPSAGLVQPVDIQSRSDDPRLYVAERGGLVRIVSNGAPLAQPYADLTQMVFLEGDVGLRAFAFDPDYATNGHAYFWFDEDNGTPGVDGVLVRMTRSAADSDRVDPSTLEEILRVPQDGRSHGGGSLVFDPEGLLLLAIGDGNPGGDQFCRAQDLSNLLGSVIRIDVSGALPYTVPVDNPFVGNPSVRPEILHYGLRHPWKWAMDPSNGALWLADVGQQEREEIDYVPPGSPALNFGWPVLEGLTCFPTPCTGLPPCASASLTPPVFDYEHTLGCSVTGGKVPITSSVSDFNGAFVFTDFCSGRMWSARADANGAVNVVQHGVTVYPSGANLILPTTMGLDWNGDLLVADYVDGEIYRIAPAESFQPICPGMPNAVGSGANLQTHGTSSLSGNNLRLRTVGVPPFSLGILFYGPEQAARPAGNGMVCVGRGNGSISRAKIETASDFGGIEYPLDLTMAPFNAGVGQIVPGSTWYFQTWYRDIGGPLGAATNFSSAYAIRFRP